MTNLTNQSIEQLARFRKDLHKHPELSGEEAETARAVLDFLESYAPDQLISGLGGHGIAAVYGKGDNGPSVLIRCELDALPIQEINEFEYRSVTDGVSHKCGHDGHMTMVAGLAALLHKNRPEKGRVILLFQPAEENGEGAVAILKDARFKDIEPDYVFALHNLPGFPLGQVVCRDGSFTACVESVSIHFDGKTSHAGEPEKGVNPALSIANALEQAMKMQQPIDATDFLQVTPIQISMGEEAYGISAGHGILRLTIRSWKDEVMAEAKQRIDAFIHSTDGQNGLSVRGVWSHAFAANQNHPMAVGKVRKAAEEIGLDYRQMDEAFRWGEDFGLFTTKYPGAMFGLGAGEECPALHNPDYDFPDGLIPLGIGMFHHILRQLLDEEV